MGITLKSYKFLLTLSVCVGFISVYLMNTVLESMLFSMFRMTPTSQCWCVAFWRWPRSFPWFQAKWGRFSTTSFRSLLVSPPGMYTSLVRSSFPADPTELSWRRVISPDGNQYSWAYICELSLYPYQHYQTSPLSLYGDTSVHGSAKARRVPAMIAQVDLDNLSTCRPVHVHAFIMCSTENN